MDRTLTRIHRGYFFAYYRRLGALAAQEATRRWFAWLGASFFVAVLTFCLLLIGGGDGLSSAAWGLLAFGVSWLMILTWFVVTIPPRIENDLQRKEEALRVLTQRQNVGTEIRNLMNTSRMRARQAREKIIESETTGIRVEADPIQQEALNFARAAQDRLEWLGKQTGQFPYDSNITEIQEAVSSAACADPNAAIRQLERLADVFSRQLVGPDYR